MSTPAAPGGGGVEEEARAKAHELLYEGADLSRCGDDDEPGHLDTCQSVTRYVATHREADETARRNLGHWIERAHHFEEACASLRREVGELRARLTEIAEAGCEGDDEHAECGDVCVGHDPCDCWPHVAARALSPTRDVAAKEPTP